ncbi:holin-associated N-acetylmuramidase [Oceanomicrobium pacificus]|uniref:Peptidoglycan-binding protein n=1 Tax=Oceanomicrobium pacificus TaxID=2692916 RepID=A0A6B0TYD5_9RHOB|nr:holin-associated N-acetylmuramidase [Oceanomicrobium pacificus]MXU66292.1 peptidoglycan-binding protein [Oceanomicrobium pacificus]
MRTVQQLAAEIVRREGGYVDDPDDPGGPTNFGVTLATMRRAGPDLDGDGDRDLADLKRLSAADAAQIFIRDYYHGPGLDGLPDRLQPPVFDMQVNAGAMAVRILQALLRGFGRAVAVDGTVGPATRAAAAAAARDAGALLVDAYGIARRNYYYALGDARPPLRKYARRRDGGKGGWIIRAEEFIRPRYHLSGDAHAARVAAWG